MTSKARTPLVAGNWKMNGSLAASSALVSSLRAGAKDLDQAGMLLCPPYAYLKPVADWLAGTNIALGAQDVSDRVGSGAFTGEISGEMLKDVGCSYVIVGHSERRSLYAESDELVAGKFVAAQSCGLTPILCVGETLEEREGGRTEAVVERQLRAVLENAGVDAFASAVVAYEPVWAIGTGRTASPDQAQEVHAFIRRIVGDRNGTIAAGLAILYGGSVKGANAASLFAMEDIDGGLIGGASLEASEFLAIFGAAAST